MAVTGLLLAPSWVWGQGSDAETLTLLTKYRSAIKQLRSAHEQIHISGSVHQVMENKGKPPIRDHTYKIDYAANGHHEKLNEVFRFNGFLDRVYVQGERSFALRRTTEGGPYVVDQLGELPRSFIAEFNDNKNMLVNAALSISELAISPLLDSPRFTLRRAARVGPDKATLVRFDFDYRPEHPKEEYDMAGWFVVDPDRAWSVIEYEVHRKIPGLPKSEQLDMLITGKIRYPTEPGPISTFPERVIVTFLSLIPGGRQFERRYDFKTESCSTDPIPIREFTLAAYGLDYLDRPMGQSRNMAAYWAFGLAATAAAASIFLRRINR